jgi:hypothetical protein
MICATRTYCVAINQKAGCSDYEAPDNIVARSHSRELHSGGRDYCHIESMSTSKSSLQNTAGRVGPRLMIKVAEASLAGRRVRRSKTRYRLSLIPMEQVVGASG